MTEHGEIVTDLPVFAMTHPHVWITHDPTELLNLMLAKYGDMLRYQFTDTEDPDMGEVTMSAARLINFGFERGKTKYGNQARHTVWHPARMFSAPRVAVDLIGGEFQELIKFALDVRSWCESNNLPLRSTLPGIASSLTRDERFWPNPRGRVPRATNEKVRPYLPGVYQESRAPVIQTIPAAVALDQVRAYHRAAQEVPTPHPTYIYARGYFAEPERVLTDPTVEVWAPRGSALYKRTIAQPGLVALVASSRPKRKGEWRPPLCEPIERTVRYVWTNELPFAQRHGLQIEGLTAAWTSEVPDDGLPRYGRWAEDQINQADAYRRQWLKPTLHSVYGLFAARSRDLLIGHSHADGGVETQYLIRGHAYNVKEVRIRNQQPATVNVATLGVLQSAIRERTLDLANMYGDDVLHVHADGLHLKAIQLEFPPNGWTAEPVTNLYYIDNVSWLSEQRDVLPGRDQWHREELRRRAHAIHT